MIKRYYRFVYTQLLKYLSRKVGTTFQLLPLNIEKQFLAEKLLREGVNVADPYSFYLPLFMNQKELFKFVVIKKENNKESLAHLFVAMTRNLDFKNYVKQFYSNAYKTAFAINWNSLYEDLHIDSVIKFLLAKMIHKPFNDVGGFNKNFAFLPFLTDTEMRLVSNKAYESFIFILTRDDYKISTISTLDELVALSLSGTLRLDLREDIINYLLKIDSYGRGEIRRKALCLTIILLWLKRYLSKIDLKRLLFSRLPIIRENVYMILSENDLLKGRINYLKI